MFQWGHDITVVETQQEYIKYLKDTYGIEQEEDKSFLPGIVGKLENIKEMKNQLKEDPRTFLKSLGKQALKKTGEKSGKILEGMFEKGMELKQSLGLLTMSYEFQFLIGKVKTDVIRRVLEQSGLFQFLIGKVKTP